MPIDPDSPFVPVDPSQGWQTRELPRIVVHPKPPPNAPDPDGIDDWFVPGQASSPDVPNNRSAPWTPGTDAFFPDDWIYPDSWNAPMPPAGPRPAFAASSARPNAPNPASSNRPAPLPDPYAAYWSQIPASRLTALAWAPPVFPSSSPFLLQSTPASSWLPPPLSPDPFDTVPPSTLAPGPAGYGVLGGIPAMLAASNDPLSSAGSRGILGALANLQPGPSVAQKSAFNVFDPPSFPSSIAPYATAASAAPTSATGNKPEPEQDQIQLAQALPPIFFARPPVLIPRQLTPLEELPPGSAGGPGAGKPFPRSFNDQQPEGIPCTYCGRPTTKEPGPDNLHGDHIIPRSQGGNNTWENYAPACRTCNLEKSSRTPEEWYFWLKSGGEI